MRGGHGFEGPRLRAEAFVEFEEFLTKQGVNARSVIGLAGFKPEQVRGGQALLPFEAVAELLQLAARESGNSSLALDYAQWLEVGRLGLLDHLILSAATVKEALQLVARYAEVLVFPIEAEFHARSHQVELIVRFPLSINVPTGQLMDLIAAVLVLRLRLSLGNEWVPLFARLPRSTSANADRLADLFGPKIEQTTSELAIGVAINDAAARMPGSWAGLAETVRVAANKVLDEHRAQSDFVGMVRLAITDCFAREIEVRLDTIARRLDTNARSLQWQLSQRDVRFHRLVLDVRRETAKKLLLGSSLRMHEISQRLGFSESSAFTRWANQHLGASPREFRIKQGRVAE